MSGERVAVRYSAGEEWANSVTHGVGIVLSVAGLAFLLFAARGTGGARELAACAVYGAALILVYTTSTLYHGVVHAPSKRVLRTVDHLAIFLLIAGTYTPFTLIALRGVWSWALFLAVWALALIGVIIEMTPLGRSRRVMVVLYVAMGWIGLVAIEPLVAALPSAGLWLLFGGGASYTFGVLFYQWHSLRYHHAVWHLFVLGGSVLQYFSVLWYVLPLA